MNVYMKNQKRIGVCNGILVVKLKKEPKVLSRAIKKSEIAFESHKSCFRKHVTFKQIELKRVDCFEKSNMDFLTQLVFMLHIQTLLLSGMSRFFALHLV